MESTVKLYSLGYKEAKTYLFAALFIIGNILFPQLCHLIPNGGHIFLPIYFFTLIGAYKYGWKVGLLTAVLSPIINSALLGCQHRQCFRRSLLNQLSLQLQQPPSPQNPSQYPCHC